MSLLAEACLLLNDGERAATLYAQMLPYRRRFVHAALFASWAQPSTTSPSS
jgi:hypothetical protein